jgi:hypothetical protein
MAHSLRLRQTHKADRRFAAQAAKTVRQALGFREINARTVR